MDRMHIACCKNDIKQCKKFCWKCHDGSTTVAMSCSIFSPTVKPCNHHPGIQYSQAFSSNGKKNYTTYHFPNKGERTREKSECMNPIRCKRNIMHNYREKAEKKHETKKSVKKILTSSKLHLNVTNEIIIII